jgi:predicted acetyltransferase
VEWNIIGVEGSWINLELFLELAVVALGNNKITMKEHVRQDNNGRSALKSEFTSNQCSPAANLKFYFPIVNRILSNLE